MKMRSTLMLAAAVAFGFGACGDDHDHGAGHGHSHEIKARHGGQVFHLADHGPAMELVWDGAAGTMKLFSYDSEGNAKDTDEAPVLNIDKGPTQVTGKGKGSEWTFTHENLKKEAHPHARFKVKIGGEVYNNDKWHPPEH